MFLLSGWLWAWWGNARLQRGQHGVMTFTRTHVFVELANQYLVCSVCRMPVRRWHNNDKCGCDAKCWNDPCGHSAEAVSVCPSWSPVDGCNCQEFLGKVDHSFPPSSS